MNQGTLHKIMKKGKPELIVPKTCIECGAELNDRRRKRCNKCEAFAI